MDFNEFLSELEAGIPRHKDDFVQELLGCLLEKYKSLNNCVIALNYEISESRHSVLLKTGDSSFFELNFNEDGIHLIIGSFERIYFFDDDFFRLNYQGIFDKLFKGDYKIVHYNSFFSTTSMLFFTDEAEKLNAEIATLVNKNKSYNVIEGKVLVEVFLYKK